MPLGYAIECDDCLARSFVAPSQGAWSPAPEQAPYLHRCSGCQIYIPRAWARCTTCDCVAARARLRAMYWRVAVAWDCLPPAERPEAIFQALLAHDATIQVAYSRREWAALEAAIAAYEQTAAPLLAAAQQQQEIAA